MPDMTTVGNPSIAEAYFLVRVGTWGEAELTRYIQQHVALANRDIDQDTQQAWRDGYTEGLQAGISSDYPEERW